MSFLHAPDYLALPRTPMPYIIDRLLPIGGLLSLYGDPKAGKSQAALLLARAIAQGCPDWFGFPIRATGPVAYLQLDNPRAEWTKRLDALAAHQHTFEGVHFCDRRQLPDGLFPFDILRDAHATWLHEALRCVDPLTVIIDTIRKIHSADEDNATAMSTVLGRLTAACEPAAIVVVAHARKPKPDTPVNLMTGQRGSNQILGDADTVIRLTKKRLYIDGRDILEQTVHITTLPGRIPARDATEDRLLDLCRAVLDTHPYATQREQVEAIHAQMAALKLRPPSFDTTRRRLLAAQREAEHEAT